MNFPFFIAQRYLRSKKSTNAIQIISLISLAGVCIGSAALIIILSVFNGFEGLVVSLYEKVNPDFVISPVTGKTFLPDSAVILQLKKEPDITAVTEVLQDNALLRYGKLQYFASVKGVSNDFLKNKMLDSIMTRGQFVIEEDSNNYAVIGKGVEYNLSINLAGAVDQISIFAPRSNSSINMVDPSQGLKRMEIYPSGVFSSQQELDEKTVFVSLAFARQLFEQKKKLSSLEISIRKYANVLKIRKKISELLGTNFRIKDRFQQNETLFKVLNSEKWAIYLILTFVLIIAICNIIGSLTMLVIDKKKDIAVLMSMGAGLKEIRSVFILQGLMIAVIGALSGLFLGFIFCLLQQYFGLIKFGNTGSFMVDAYPVIIKFSDFLLVFFTVLIISFIASSFTTFYNINRKKEFRVQMD